MREGDYRYDKEHSIYRFLALEVEDQKAQR